MTILATPIRVTPIPATPIRASADPRYADDQRYAGSALRRRRAGLCRSTLSGSEFRCAGICAILCTGDRTAIRNPGTIRAIRLMRDQDWRRASGPTQQPIPITEHRLSPGAMRAGGEYAPAKRRGSMVTVLAVLALAVVGTAAAFGYRAVFSGAGTAVPPPVIKADVRPSKVVPATDPNNKPIQDRIGVKTEKIVPRQEEPVQQAAPGQPRGHQPVAGRSEPAGVPAGKRECCAGRQHAALGRASPNVSARSRSSRSRGARLRRRVIPAAPLQQLSPTRRTRPTAPDGVDADRFGCHVRPHARRMRRWRLPIPEAVADRRSRRRCRPAPAVAPRQAARMPFR